MELSVQTLTEYKGNSQEKKSLRSQPKKTMELMQMPFKSESDNTPKRPKWINETENNPKTTTK